MPPTDKLVELPDDSEALKAMVRSLLLEHDAEKRRADDLHIENLRLQVELDRYKKWYYGPRADRLQSTGELAQMLLGFAEALDQQAGQPGRCSAACGAGRRTAAGEAAQGPAPSGQLRKSSGHHACIRAERGATGLSLLRRRAQGDRPGGELADRAYSRALRAHPSCAQEVCLPGLRNEWRQPVHRDRGQAGDGRSTRDWPDRDCWPTSSPASSPITLPLYRLEDIFARQGFEISRATQSVWCGDVADLVEPLYELMADQVRASHVVATDDTIMPMLSREKCANARMWVYVGDDAHPYNVFDFTLSRGRDGPKYFLKDYNQVLLADGYGGYNGVVAGNGIVRAGCWAHLRRKIHRCGKGRARDRAAKRSSWCARSTPSRSKPKMLPSRSGSACARSSRRRCWPSCVRSSSRGKSSYCPSILWPRRSTTLSASGRN